MTVVYNLFGVFHSANNNITIVYNTLPFHNNLLAAVVE